MGTLKESVALPLKESEDSVSWVLAYPHDAYTRVALEMAVGKPAHVQVGLVSEILGAIEQLYGNKQSAISELSDVIQVTGDGEDTDIQHLRDLASEAPIVRLVNLIINQAVERRASDIHIEPYRGKLLVRYRIDGLLRDVEAPPTRSAAAVVSRIKLIANLNIAERRLPQDGRFQVLVQGREIDIRVSTMPTLLSGRNLWFCGGICSGRMFASGIMRAV